MSQECENCATDSSQMYKIKNLNNVNVKKSKTNAAATSN